jgi:hypothetical protein
MIPPVAHFVWFGDRFPWQHYVALASASRRGGFERLVCHVSGQLSGEPWYERTLQLPLVEARPIDASAILSAADHTGLTEVYERLSQPAARSNVLRLAILLAEGGVYLDFDTITVGSLEEQRGSAGFFCGAERLVFPGKLVRSRHPLAWAAAGARTAAREVLRRVPSGWRAFRLLEHYYPAAVNNAVLGATPGHPFVQELLRRMVEMPLERQLRRFALGTHLLQETVAEASTQDLVVHPPEVFYPLGPLISEHWFRESGTAPEALMTPATRVVHWYASNSTARMLERLGPDTLAKSKSPFAALTRAYAT